MEYAVKLALIAERPLTEDELFEVAEIAATTGNPGGARLDATFIVEADSLMDAAERAQARLRERVSGTVIAIDTMTSEENERRIAEPALEVIGITEIAAALGVSKQRVFQLMERDDFPAPLAVLACGSIWRKGDLSTFADGWQRKAGRPRRAPAAVEARAEA